MKEEENAVDVSGVVQGFLCLDFGSSLFYGGGIGRLVESFEILRIGNGLFCIQTIRRAFDCWFFIK
jgi:hypothetical protein